MDQNLSRSDAPARGLSRRQLIKAGAWAAPAIVIAAAVPAASASGGVTNEKAAVAKYSFTVSTENAAGRVKGSMQLGYDYGIWGGHPIVGPSTLQVAWVVEVIDAGNNVTTIMTDSATINAYGNTGERGFAYNGLPAGPVTVRLRTTSVIPAPNPITQQNGDVMTFKVPLTTWDTPLTIL